MMKKQDYVFIGILSVLAVFIWMRDTTWISTADDTLPILIAIPLFVWFGMPWKFRNHFVPISRSWIIISALLFLSGIALNITLLLALGWTLLLWGWLSNRLESEQLDSRMKLMILPLMAFPWVTLDAVTLGWWFRISGAWVTAHLVAFSGYQVLLEGTILVVDQIPINVEAACSGLNNLQSMLIAGSVVAYMYLSNTNRYWWNLPLIILMDWIANTTRIIMITYSALKISPEFAMGAFHTWGGWLVLFLMFSLCWFIFSLQEKQENEEL